MRSSLLVNWFHVCVFWIEAPRLLHDIRCARRMHLDKFIFKLDAKLVFNVIHYLWIFMSLESLLKTANLFYVWNNIFRYVSYRDKKTSSLIYLLKRHVFKLVSFYFLIFRVL